MVTPSRNAPCPCGSGRKYKSCCLERDRAAAAAQDRRPTRAATEHPWEVGIFPVPTLLEDRPDRRVSVAMVTAGGLILHFDFLDDPLARVDEVVDALEAALDAAEGHVGVAPRLVRVRHHEVSRALAARLAVRGIRVEREHRMAGLEEAARAMSRDTFQVDALPMVASSPTWRGWGLSPARCRALFAAAARFRRAAPWERIDEAEAITGLALGGFWAAVVRGAESDEGDEGLTLYTDFRDHDEEPDLRAEPGAWIDGLHGAVLFLSFEARDGLTREMQREVAGAGWEVADPDGYPLLYTAGAPAGGLDPVAVDALTAFLVAIPDLLDALDTGFGDARGGQQIDWEHPVSGFSFRYVMPGAFEWDLPDRLEPGGPDGPGAEPGAVLPEPEGPEDAIPEAHIVDDFEAHLRGSVAEQTAARHARNALGLVQLVNGRHGAPLRAMHEFDLRSFLYDDFPRDRPGYTRTDALPASLRHFLAFLAERHGLDFPWAEPIVRDTEPLRRRVASAPTGPFWDQDVLHFRADLYQDLDRRVMLLPDDWAGSLEPAALTSPGEASLRRHAQRLWLAWRDELIAAGTVEPVPLRHALDLRLRDWLARRHEDDPDGRTRLDYLRAERERIPAREQDDMMRALFGTQT